jgi:hypothetical protein
MILPTQLAMETAFLSTFGGTQVRRHLKQRRCCSYWPMLFYVVLCVFICTTTYQYKKNDNNVIYEFIRNIYWLRCSIWHVPFQDDDPSLPSWLILSAGHGKTVNSKMPLHGDLMMYIGVYRRCRKPLENPWIPQGSRMCCYVYFYMSKCRDFSLYSSIVGVCDQTVSVDSEW